MACGAADERAQNLGPGKERHADGYREVAASSSVKMAREHKRKNIIEPATGDARF
jgi:hypothetical protein